MSMKLIPCLLAVLFLPGVHTAKAQTQSPSPAVGDIRAAPFERAVACTKFYDYDK